MREIARQLGVWPKTVRHWRGCWLASAADAPMTVRLSDAARPGTPAMVTPEQVCTIMALACEPPEQSDRPLSHWSQSDLAREAVRRFLQRGRRQGASRARLAHAQAGR